MGDILGIDPARNDEFAQTNSVRAPVSALIVDDAPLLIQYGTSSPSFPRAFVNMVEFTTRIKEFRARNGFTQAELADMVDVRHETISHLERGRYNPSLELAYRVSRALDTTIEDLFIFEDD